MPLISDARLGPYQILAAIGAGGMGEVYRAADRNLDGRELFYIGLDGTMLTAVPVEPHGEELRFGAGVPLFNVSTCPVSSAIYASEIKERTFPPLPTEVVTSSRRRRNNRGSS